MLHFLRHIRQKLILQDNVRRYLLYAIGEILLVVIGILIALQVNNWNQERSRASDEYRILMQIQKESMDAIESRNQINDTFTLLRSRIAASMDKIFRNDTNELTKQECFSVFQSHIIRWNPINISTLEEIVTSGKIGIISDNNLRSMLIEFRNVSNSNQQSLLRTINEANVLVDNYPDLIIRTWVPEVQNSEFECDVPGMRENPFFLTQLQSNYGRMTSPVRASEEESAILQDILLKLELMLN